MSPLMNSVVLWGTGVVIVLFLGWLFWLDVISGRPAKRERSGFEVKLNASEELAAKEERDNDHG